MEILQDSDEEEDRAGSSTPHEESSEENQSEIDLQQAILESEAGLPDEVEDLTIENRKTEIVPQSELHVIKQAEVQNVTEDEDAADHVDNGL